MRRFTSVLALLVAALFLTSCLDGIFSSGDDDNGESTNTGTLEVTTQTSGSDIDSDGYVIGIEGESATENADPSDTIYFTGLEEGSYQVVLDTSSVSSNCALEDDAASKNVTVVAGDTTSTTYEVACQQIAGNKIVFTSNRDGDYEIFLMNADGSNPQQITDNTTPDNFPVLSNDGTKIAFYSERGTASGELYIMDVDGSDVQQVTTSPSAPQFYSWSPDDSKIVYSDPRSGNYEIYTIDIDGNNRTRLTNDTSIDIDPDWSPNGRIAFRSDRSGSQEIHTMDADGSDKEQITSDTGFLPRWSPDGSQIAFTSGRSGNMEIYVMNSDGTGLLQVTNHGDFDTFPTWSPDGSSIAFQTDRDGNDEIYRISSDGTGSVVNLTVEMSDDIAPHWSPVE